MGETGQNLSALSSSLNFFLDIAPEDVVLGSRVAASAFYPHVGGMDGITIAEHF